MIDSPTYKFNSILSEETTKIIHNYNLCKNYNYNDLNLSIDSCF